MQSQRRIRPIPFLIAFVLVGSSASADTITITLDNVSVGSCGPSWNEAGCPLWFESTTAEDLTYPYCLVTPHVSVGPYAGVYIFPARLVLDLTGMTGLETVEVDVYETHFAGSTRAFLYNGGAQIDYAQSTQTLTHTLALVTGGSPVDRFVVSAHESAVWEIRLSGSGLTATEPATFGRVKAAYR